MSLTVKKIKDRILSYINMGLEFNKINRVYSTLYIQGRPGIGKSEVISQICKENNYNLKVVYMSILPLEKLTGLPIINKKDDYAEWSKPDIVRFDFDNDRPTILLLDDAHLINKQYQSYLFELLIYRQINGYKIDDNVIIILAGNKPDDMANFQPILSPVVNRLSFIEIKIDTNEWVEYASTLDMDKSVIDFIMFNDQYLLGQPMESYPWPSPRSWVHLGYDIKYNKNNIDNILSDVVKGYVGGEAAVEFMKFYKLYSKWDINILTNNEFKKKIENSQYTEIDVYSALIKIYRDMCNKKDKQVDDLIQKYSNIIEICSLRKYKVFVSVLIKVILLDKSNKIKTSDKIINCILDNDKTKEIVYNLIN